MEVFILVTAITHGFRGQPEAVKKVASMLEWLSAVHFDVDFRYEYSEDLPLFKGLVTSALSAIESGISGSTTHIELERNISNRASTSKRLAEAVHEYNKNVLAVNTPYRVQSAGYQYGDSFGFLRFAIGSDCFVWVFFTMTLASKQVELGVGGKHGILTILGADWTTSNVQPVYPNNRSQLLGDIVESAVRLSEKESSEYLAKVEQNIDKVFEEEYGLSASLLYRTLALEADLGYLSDGTDQCTPETYADVLASGCAVCEEVKYAPEEGSLYSSLVESNGIGAFSVSPLFQLDCGGTLNLGADSSTNLWMSLNGQKIHLRQG